MCDVAVLHRPADLAGAELCERVRSMNDRVAHRGPDGEGTFVDEHAGIALGHRRLAIVGLSEEGAQPMTSRRHRREHQSGRHNWDYRLWAVLMLMSWAEQLQQGPPARTPA